MKENARYLPKVLHFKAKDTICLLQLFCISNFVMSSELHEVVSLPDAPPSSHAPSSFRSQHFSDLRAEHSISRPRQLNQFHNGRNEPSQYPPTYNNPPGAAPGPQQFQQYHQSTPNPRYEFQENFSTDQDNRAVDQDHRLMDRAREQMPYNGQSEQRIISDNLRYLNGNVFGLSNSDIEYKQVPFHETRDTNQFQAEDVTQYHSSPTAPGEFNVAQDSTGNDPIGQPSVNKEIHLQEVQSPYKQKHLRPHEVIEVIVEEQRDQHRGHTSTHNDGRQRGTEINYHEGSGDVNHEEVPINYDESSDVSQEEQPVNYHESAVAVNQEDGPINYQHSSGDVNQDVEESITPLQQYQQDYQLDNENAGDIVTNQQYAPLENDQNPKLIYVMSKGANNDNLKYYHYQPNQSSMYTENGGGSDEITHYQQTPSKSQVYQEGGTDEITHYQHTPALSQVYQEGGTDEITHYQHLPAKSQVYQEGGSHKITHYQQTPAKSHVYQEGGSDERTHYQHTPAKSQVYQEGGSHEITHYQQTPAKSHVYQEGGSDERTHYQHTPAKSQVYQEGASNQGSNYQQTTAKSHVYQEGGSDERTHYQHTPAKSQVYQEGGSREITHYQQAPAKSYVYQEGGSDERTHYQHTPAKSQVYQEGASNQGSNYQQTTAKSHVYQEGGSDERTHYKHTPAKSQVYQEGGSNQGSNYQNTPPNSLVYQEGGSNQGPNYQRTPTNSQVYQEGDSNQGTNYQQTPTNSQVYQEVDSNKGTNYQRTPTNSQVYQEGNSNQGTNYQRTPTSSQVYQEGDSNQGTNYQRTPTSSQVYQEGDNNQGTNYQRTPTSSQVYQEGDSNQGTNYQQTTVNSQVYHSLPTSEPTPSQQNRNEVHTIKDQFAIPRLPDLNQVYQSSTSVYQRTPSQYVLAEVKPTNSVGKNEKKLTQSKYEHNDQTISNKERHTSQSNEYSPSQLQYTVAKEPQSNLKQYHGVDHHASTLHSSGVLQKQYQPNLFTTFSGQENAKVGQTLRNNAKTPIYVSSSNSPTLTAPEVSQYFSMTSPVHNYNNGNSTRTLNHQSKTPQNRPKSKPTPSISSPRPWISLSSKKSLVKVMKPDVSPIMFGSGAIPGDPGKDYPIYTTIPKNPKFNCRSKSAGFYSDTQHGCQVYYQCSLTGDQQGFLCPNGTLFNQVSLVCEWWYNVDCKTSERHFDKNKELYQQPGNTAGSTDYLADESKAASADHHETDLIKQKQRKSLRSVGTNQRRNYVKYQRQAVFQDDMLAAPSIFVPITAVRNAMRSRRTGRNF